MSIQKQVYELVAARGYMEGWSPVQAAVRQVCKVVEETGELAALVEEYTERGALPMFVDKAYAAGKMARWAFDQQPDACVFADLRLEGVRDGRLEKEIADVVVPILVLCELLGIDFESAVTKAVVSDVSRGVRKPSL